MQGSKSGPRPFLQNVHKMVSPIPPLFSEAQRHGRALEIERSWRTIRHQSREVLAAADVLHVADRETSTGADRLSDFEPLLLVEGVHRTSLPPSSAMDDFDEERNVAPQGRFVFCHFKYFVCDIILQMRFFAFAPMKKNDKFRPSIPGPTSPSSRSVAEHRGFRPVQHGGTASTARGNRAEGDFGGGEGEACMGARTDLPIISQSGDSPGRIERVFLCGRTMGRKWRSGPRFDGDGPCCAEGGRSSRCSCCCHRARPDLSNGPRENRRPSGTTHARPTTTGCVPPESGAILRSAILRGGRCTTLPTT